MRASDAPVILAVRASGLCSRFSHFDEVLFGSAYEVHGFHDEVLERGFRANGEFARPGSSSPTYAAILAFLHVDFHVCTQPVLYVHPRFSGQLPSSLLSLERRYLASDRQGIEVIAAASQELLGGFRFVDAT